MNLWNKHAMAAMTVLACASAQAQDTYQLNFARVGTSYSAFIGSDNPIVGRRVISAHIVLNVNITGGDATNFFTDILLPIEPDAGNDAALVITGEELQWSGLGVFEYDIETERHNGVIIARRFGAETPGEGFDGEILEGSMIELRLEPAGCPADFNQDGFLDFFDYSDFVTCFEDSNCPGETTADFNQDGFVDFFDYGDYVTAFETGC